MVSSVPKGPEDVFDLDRLEKIIELMKQHGLTEVDLQQEKNKIRLSRGGNSSAAAMPATMPATPHALIPGTSAMPSAPPESNGNLVTITSPMVGTFYLKPNPDAENFVSVGSAVGKDTVVCIIEAMKVFNEIPADVQGKIVAILVDNEEPVEFGKPLFKVDTSQ